MWSLFQCIRPRIYAITEQSARMAGPRSALVISLSTVGVYVQMGGMAGIVMVSGKSDITSRDQSHVSFNSRFVR
jgi:hypothetical protein